MSKERYCHYCRLFKPNDGFKLVNHYGSGTQRSMCPTCQETRKKPRTLLEEMAKREREERRGEIND
jgi:hypothetical protein